MGIFSQGQQNNYYTSLNARIRHSHIVDMTASRKNGEFGNNWEFSVLWEQKPGRGPRIWLWFCNSVSATPKICFFAWYEENLCYNKSHQLWMQNQQSQGKQNDQGRLGKTLLLGEHLRLLKVQPVLCSDPFLCSSQSNVEITTSFPEHWMVGFPIKSFSSSQSLTFSLSQYLGTDTA